METQPTTRTTLQEGEWGEGLRYVARQPILDLRGRVHAYELLFRAGPETAFRGDVQKAANTMLDNVTMFGLDKLAGGLPAFVNCTQEVLAEDLGDILPTGMTVLEILETVEPTPAVIEASRKLKAMGYRLALDDFVWAPKFEPLVKLADYIKVDFLLTGTQERTELFDRLRGSSIVMLAEKVETQEQYQQAKDEGFTLFQGYYFCRPLLIRNRKIPANRVHHLELLHMLQSENFDVHKATELMKRNASLTYRLLRMVNSPMFAHADIHSIQEALMLVGENAFRHMVMVAIASDLNGEQPVEILRIAFLRARFCQLASAYRGLTSGEQFLLGMLSLLPAMMLLPMEELVPALPLRGEMQAALMGTANRERVLLGWLESYERGDWAACDMAAQSNGLEQEQMLCYYQSALTWAAAALQISA